jgi:hypothetical protein
MRSVLNNIFHAQSLPLFDFVICLLLFSAVLIAVEIEKWLMRAGIIYTNCYFWKKFVSFRLITAAE